AILEIELPSPSARSEQDAAVLDVADGLAIVPSGLPTRVEEQHQPSTDGRIPRQREEPSHRDVRDAHQTCPSPGAACRHLCSAHRRLLWWYLLEDRVTLSFWQP